MQRKKHFITISIILVAIVEVIGCTTPKQAFESNINGWLPENFSPKTGTLLVVGGNMPGNQQTKILAYLEKSYPYKYEFVEPKTWKQNPKYNDLKAYPFALVSDMEQKQRFDSKGMPSQTMYMFDYYFIDRQKNKVYPKSGAASTGAYHAFETVMKKILETK